MDIKIRTVRILASICGCFLVLSLGFGQQQSHEEMQPSGEGIFVSRPPSSAPRPIYTPQPEYPASLRNSKDKIQGTCLLKVKIDKQGRVSEINVTRSLDKRLDQSAIDAVKLWKFEPAMIDGKPVTAVIPVELDFHPDQRKQ